MSDQFDVDAFKKEFKKMFGDDIVINANDVAEQTKQVIPVSPSLDIALSGGIPEGTLVTCSGKPKTGKTVTTLCFAANCQKPEYGGRHVFFLNVEGRLKSMNLKGTKGLNLDKFTIIQSTPDKILSAQDFLKIALHIIKTYPKCLLIIDSESALCDDKELDTGIEYQNRGGVNKVFAGFIRQVSNVIPVQNSIVWCIRHLTQSQSQFGTSWNEKGAMTTQYQADVQMRIKFDKAWCVGSGDKQKQVGQEVHWLIESSALGRPHLEAVSFIRYGTGIDGAYEMINLALDTGLITKAGAWLTADFMKRHLPLLGIEEWNEEANKQIKAQGVDKMLTLLNENPSWLQALIQEVKAIL